MYICVYTKYMYKLGIAYCLMHGWAFTGSREGGGGGGVADRLGWGDIRILYKAPKDYTKTQNIMQRHKILTKY